MTEEKKKETQGLSRREFLKDAGLLVGGTAIGSTILLAACAGEETTKTVETTKTITSTAPGTTSTVTTTAPGTTSTVTSTTTATETVEVPMTFPMSEGYIVHDSTKCATCQSCMLACYLAHEGVDNTALSRIQILQNTFNRFPDTVYMSVCRQCVTPLCVQACPTGACHVDTANGNVRVIDESVCIGCQMCIQACPFVPHRTIWNPDKNVAMKCDLCLNTPYWNEEGGPNGKQLCVEVCPMEALAFVEGVPSQIDDVGYDVNLRT